MVRVGTQVQTMERLRGTEEASHQLSGHQQLAGAEAGGLCYSCVYREDLYPSVTYRRSYDALVCSRRDRADKGVCASVAVSD